MAIEFKEHCMAAEGPGRPPPVRGRSMHRPWPAPPTSPSSARSAGRRMYSLTSTRCCWTDILASLRCAQAGAAAGSYAAATAVSQINQDCIAASASTNADTIRSMLGLPPLG